jgi:hypothetical protein
MRASRWGLTRDVGVLGERRHNMSARDVAELRVEDEGIAVIFIKNRYKK